MVSKSVWARFIEARDLHPEKTAIEFEDQTISYQELAFNANAIAHYLLKSNKEPNIRIAFLIEDRIKAITTMLAVLNAGFAFVPLDPEDPEDRLQLVLEDCEPLYLIATNQELEKAKKIIPINCNLVNFDQDINLDLEVDCSEENDFKDNLAYILYTSGTTGKPKGVCQLQKNLVYFVDAYSKKLDIHQDDRVSLIYTLSFSAANMDIFGALFNGATLCAYNMRKDGAHNLANWFEKQKISVLHAVPTVMRKTLNENKSDKKFENVRTIDLGGEAVTLSDVKLFYKHFNASCIIINHLAATEASVISQFAIPLSWKSEVSLVPVGKPPSEVKISILNEEGKIVPPGSRGRIKISSPYISPGYWRSDELNKKYFSDNAEMPGWRNFFSDDLGIVNEDGDLIFLGRDGTRIKIRGQSVDLNEVELSLKKCKGINEAVVLPYHEHQNVEADALIGHIVMKSGVSADFLKIRRELSETLPQYMVPHLFMTHTTLPQTASGKIDRRHLKTLRVKQNVSSQGGVANYLEANIAQVFMRIIKLNKLPNRKDDFFLLGGDSMGAVQLQLELNNMIDREVPIKDMIADSTVMGLAILLEKLSHTKEGNASSILVKLSDKGSMPPLFLVHGRAGQAPISPNFIQLLGDRQPVYAFQAKGLNGIESPAKTIEEMASDYISELKKIQPQGPYYLGAMCVGSYIVMYMAQRLKIMGEKVFPLLLIDPPTPPFVPPPEAFNNKEFVKNFSESAKSHVVQSAKEGKYNLDLKSHFRRNAAIYIAIHMVKLLTKFKPMPYEGEVCIMISEERMNEERGWGNREKFSKVFANEAKIYKLAGKHDEILDSQNPEFSKQLRSCLEYIRTFNLEI